MSRTELCDFSGTVCAAAVEGDREEVVGEDLDFKEEEELAEDTGTGLARTMDLVWTVLQRFFLISVPGDGDFRLTDLVMCGRLEVGTGGGATGTGGVASPEDGEVLSEVDVFPLLVFLFQVRSAVLAADSIISYFLAMARADLGRTGGGDDEPEWEGDGF